MDPSSPDASPDYLSAFSDLLTTGANAYKTIEGAKVTEKAANQTPPTAKLTTTTNTPIYKQVWFIPACVVAGAVLLFGLFRR